MPDSASEPVDSAASEPDLAARARNTRVAVIGGGVAGLVAAREWAKIGAQVTVLEASDRFGGAVETTELDGLEVDLIADTVSVGNPSLTALLDELRLLPLLEPSLNRPVWIAGESRAAPAPADAILGIPANCWEGDVRALIGWSGVWRAWLDRLRPPLTIGHQRSLGALVRTRMGDAVADRMVAPIARGMYGIDPDEVDVDVAAPGLNAALTRTGSLAGAVAALGSQAPSGRATLRGGLGTAVAALVERLQDLSVDLRTDARVTALVPGPPWTLVTADPDADVHADVLVLAAGASSAAEILATAGIAVAAPPAPTREVVTLVVDAPGLDAAPRGRAVYPAVPGEVLGVAHVTADWPGLADAAGPGRHVLRVTLTGDATRTDDDTVEAARAGASALLGLALPQPRASARRRVGLSAPASALSHADRTAAIRAALPASVVTVGAWVSGSGLAQVVGDAVAEVDRARSAVLWGSPH